MKTSPLVALFLALSVAIAPGMADAKRLGGGKSSGMQRDMPARTAPQQTPPSQQAAPNQAAAPAIAGAAAAAAPKRSWMGPLAGLAAGLGLGALMSSMGMGGAFGSFLLIALLAMAGFFIVRMLMARMGGRQPAGALAGAGGNGMGKTGMARVAWPPAGNNAPSAPLPPVSPAGPVTAAPSTDAPARAFVPASFDADGFGRIAKTIFIRLQAANDSGDLDDLRRFTTPEMFAELRVDLLDRGTNKQQTDVVQVNTEVLDVADDGERQIVSVRFHGEVREEAEAAPETFDEVWHLVKPADGSREWAIAGIEQQQALNRG